jgi:hypothetical protein
MCGGPWWKGGEPRGYNASSNVRWRLLLLQMMENRGGIRSKEGWSKR